MVKLLQLSTDGEFQEVEVAGSLPSPVGNSGKFLSTDGNTVYWASGEFASPPPIGNIVPNSGAFTKVTIGATDFISNTVTTNSTTTTTIFSFSQSIYRVGEFVIQASNPANSLYQGTKVLAVHDGGSGTDWTEYDSVQSNGMQCAVFQVVSDGNNLMLRATPLEATPTTFKVTGILTTK